MSIMIAKRSGYAFPNETIDDVILPSLLCLPSDNAYTFFPIIIKPATTMVFKGIISPTTGIAKSAIKS